ncbi:MAG: FG-GAP repeat protein [Verrucomicrobiae bacterium]|nr:FG-GAP repeat protein [Verrucomicrobiae bacterium]
MGFRTPQLYILTGNGDGTFGRGATFDLPGVRLDGLDAPNFSGSGGFLPMPPMHVGEEANTVATGDLNGDGKTDLAVSHFGSLGTYNGSVKVAWAMVSLPTGGAARTGAALRSPPM